MLSVLPCLYEPDAYSPVLTAGDGSAEPIEVFKFPEEVMNAAEAGGMELPFAVVGSRECDVIDDEEVPLRHFPWGTCLPLRKEHSDAVSFRYGLLLTLHCIAFGEVENAALSLLW